MLDITYDSSNTIQAIAFQGEDFLRCGKTDWLTPRWDVADLSFDQFPVGHTFDFVDGLIFSNPLQRSEILEIVCTPQLNYQVQVHLLDRLSFESVVEETYEYLDFERYIELRRNIALDILGQHFTIEDKYDSNDEPRLQFIAFISASTSCGDLFNLIEACEKQIDKETKLRIIESLL